LRASSFCRTSCASSPTASEPTHSSGDLQTKDDNNSCYSCPSSIVKLQDVSEHTINAQKTFQEWDIKWGTLAKFSFQTNTLGDSGSSKVPVGSIHSGLIALVTMGNETLRGLKSVPFAGLQSTQADTWLEVFRVVEGILERVTHITVALKSHLDTQCQT
jgi:hypothetical protein